MAGSILKRQIGGNNDNNENGYGYGGYNGGGDVDWWWTPTGMAVRYSIVAFLFAALILFFVGGYYHAQSRIRKGLPPLAYHRWMIRRSYYAPPQPRYYNQYPPGPPQEGYGQSYGMEGYPPPPPAYNNSDVPPPVYQPPPGATKAMADQSFRETNRAGEGSGSGGPLPPDPSTQH